MSEMPSSFPRMPSRPPSLRSQRDTWVNRLGALAFRAATLLDTAQDLRTTVAEPTS